MKKYCKMLNGRINKSILYIGVALLLQLVACVLLGAIYSNSDQLPFHWVSNTASKNLASGLGLDNMFAVMVSLIIFAGLSVFVARNNDINAYTNMGVTRSRNIALNAGQGVLMCIVFSIVYMLGFFVSRLILIGIHKDIMILNEVFGVLEIKYALLNIAMIFLYGMATYFFASLLIKMYHVNKILPFAVLAVVAVIGFWVAQELYFSHSLAVQGFVASYSGKSIMGASLLIMTFSGYAVMEKLVEVRA